MRLVAVGAVGKDVGADDLEAESTNPDSYYGAMKEVSLQ